MNERVLLSNLHSSFIVNMQFAFQDRDTLYLVLDLLEGGDLRHHISTRRFS
jgi:serine/threonine protein kinase